MDLDEFASERMDYIGVNVLDAGCSGDEVTMDTGVFTIPDDIPVLCKATRSFTTIEGQKVVIGQSSNVRIESPSTTLMPGVQVKVGGIFAVGN